MRLSKVVGTTSFLAGSGCLQHVQVVFGEIWIEGFGRADRRGLPFLKSDVCINKGADMTVADGSSYSDVRERMRLEEL